MTHSSSPPAALSAMSPSPSHLVYSPNSTATAAPVFLVADTAPLPAATVTKSVSQLEECEAVIDLASLADRRNADWITQQAAFRDSVHAVKRIVDDKLYRVRSMGILEYFKQRFNISRAQVYRLADASDILRDLELLAPSELRANDINLYPLPARIRVCGTIKALCLSREDRQTLWTEIVAQTLPSEVTSRKVAEVWERIVVQRELDDYADNHVSDVRTGLVVGPPRTHQQSELTGTTAQQGSRARESRLTDCRNREHTLASNDGLSFYPIHQQDLTSSSFNHDLNLVDQSDTRLTNLRSVDNNNYPAPFTSYDTSRVYGYDQQQQQQHPHYANSLSGNLVDSPSLTPFETVSQALIMHNQRQSELEMKSRLPTNIGYAASTSLRIGKQVKGRRASHGDIVSPEESATTRTRTTNSTSRGKGKSKATTKRNLALDMSTSATATKRMPVNRRGSAPPSRHVSTHAASSFPNESRIDSGVIDDLDKHESQMMMQDYDDDSTRTDVNLTFRRTILAPQDKSYTTYMNELDLSSKQRIEDGNVDTRTYTMNSVRATGAYPSHTLTPPATPQPEALSARDRRGRFRPRIGSTMTSGYRTRSAKSESAIYESQLLMEADDAAIADEKNNTSIRSMMRTGSKYDVEKHLPVDGITSTMGFRKRKSRVNALAQEYLLDLETLTEMGLDGDSLEAVQDEDRRMKLDQDATFIEAIADRDDDKSRKRKPLHNSPPKGYLTRKVSATSEQIPRWSANTMATKSMATTFSRKKSILTHLPEANQNLPVVPLKKRLRIHNPPRPPRSASTDAAQERDNCFYEPDDVAHLVQVAVYGIQELHRRGYHLQPFVDGQWLTSDGEDTIVGIQDWRFVEYASNNTVLSSAV